MSKLSLILVCIFLTFKLEVKAQNIDKLETEKKELIKKIANASKLLNQYQNKRIQNISSIGVLNNQISNRKKLIDVYSTEIQYLKYESDSLKVSVDNVKNELDLLKKQYCKLINQVYKSKKEFNEIAFFFGASSFNEAYRRYNMMKEYNRFRHNQGVLIQSKQKELINSSNLLAGKLKVKENALRKVKKEAVTLQKDRQRLDRDVKQLAQKESKVKRDLRAKRKSLKRLEETIVKLIAELNNTTVEPSDFKLAKGKLQWPLEDGVIISHFGVHQHPVLKYVKVNNNGLDIQSSKGKEVKNVFSGKVTRITPIPGYNWAVIIRHGKFLTVYANLDKVHVKNGQNVTKGDFIGTIYSGEGDNSNVLHFEIWEENVKLDPEKWLK